MPRGFGTLAAAACAGLLVVSCGSAGHAAVRSAAVAGHWGKARQVPGLAALAGAGDSGLTALSCASPGNCSGGGFFYPGAQISRSEPFVVSQLHGTWTKASTVPGIAA